MKIMKKSIKFVVCTAFASAVLISCKDANDRATETDILAQDEKTEGLTEEATIAEDGTQTADTPFRIMGSDAEVSSFNRNLMNNDFSKDLEESEEPVTIFAPSNDAYNKVSADQRKQMEDSRNKSENRKLMEYYMVDGELTVDWITDKINSSNDNSYKIRTRSGEELTAILEGEKVIIKDGSGNRAVVQKSTVDEGFGLYHTIDNMLYPVDHGSGEVLTN
jgi:uncharacterized surface protein with fasciclin (FAS1) repeats